PAPPQEDGAALGADGGRRPTGDLLQEWSELQGRRAGARDVEERGGLLGAPALLLEAARLVDGERRLLGQARQARLVPERERSRRRPVERPEERDHLPGCVQDRRRDEGGHAFGARPRLD